MAGPGTPEGRGTMKSQHSTTSVGSGQGLGATAAGSEAGGGASGEALELLGTQDLGWWLFASQYGHGQVFSAVGQPNWHFLPEHHPWLDDMVHIPC